MRGPSRAAFLAAVSAAAFSLRAASAALALPPDTTAAAADAQRELLRVLLPFDDASFRALLSLDAVSARVEALFHPLDDPSYAGALVALTRETATMETAYHVWAEGGDPAKRRFTKAAKAVAMIAVYSDPAMWPAIGYGGPLLPAATTTR
jgi:hypothetical protein